MPEIGRFFGVDPITEQFFTISPYQFAHNSPIWKVELEGLEGKGTSKDGVTDHEPVVGLVGVGTFGETAKTGATKFVKESTKEVAKKTSLGSKLFGLGSRALGTITMFLTPQMANAPTGDNAPSTVENFAVDERLRPDNPQVQVEGESDSPIQRLEEPIIDVESSVILETYGGSGNITSEFELTEDQALDVGMEFIGDDYTELGRPGSGVFRSNVENEDGTFNQFRIDNNSLDGNHPPNVPHVHLEIIDPNRRRPVVNNHIRLIQ